MPTNCFYKTTYSLNKAAEPWDKQNYAEYLVTAVCLPRSCPMGGWWGL